MLKSIFYIVVVWIVWRWLDRMFGRKQRPVNRNNRHQSPPSKSSPKKPNDDRIGDYVEFEEVFSPFGGGGCHGLFFRIGVVTRGGVDFEDINVGLIYIVVAATDVAFVDSAAHGDIRMAIREESELDRDEAMAIRRENESPCPSPLEAPKGSP